MLVVLADTHGTGSPRLSGRTAEAVDDADVVVHAGDFTTADVLDAFESRCDLRGVYGNNDSGTVQDRLPADRVVSWCGLRIAVVHGHEHSDTALSLFGRQRNVDLVVSGHSHDPEFVDGPVPTMNPGSHADPRWNRPGHAELECETAGVATGRLVEPDGEVFERFEVERRPLEQ